jgi:serine/threonine-protein kinase HSL1, negative regulator of Swe1 kinase
LASLLLSPKMADRGGPGMRIRRAPLADATDRMVNVSPQRPMKLAMPQNHEMNPLRAHPVSGASAKPTGQKDTTLTSSTVVPTLKGHDRARVSAEPHAIIPGITETSGDNRFSQISTSSGASGGNRKTHIGPWQLGRTLGKGSAARVRLARHSATQDVVAVKILAKNSTQMTVAGSMAELDKWDRTRDEFNAQRHMPLSIEREVAILKLIDHPHIVKLHDIWENRAEM